MVVYNNGQNVHFTSVNSSIVDSIKKLKKKHTNCLDVDQSMDMLLKHLGDREINLLFEYIGDDTVFSQAKMTYKEILCLVCSEIVSLNNYHICKILSDLLIDGEGKCFTGRISRLISSLAAISEEVEVRIASNQQIEAVVQNIISKIVKGMNFEEGVKEARERLTELKIPEDEQKVWIEPMGDEVEARLQAARTS